MGIVRDICGGGDYLGKIIPVDRVPIDKVPGFVKKEKIMKRYAHIEPCCDPMASHIMDYGRDQSTDITLDIKNDQLDIDLGISRKWTHCPFCGAKIEE